MIHLTTSANAQTVKVIPRSYASNVSMILRDDSTNVEVAYNLSATTDKNYLVLSQAFSLTEGRFYDLTIKEGADIIYKDKVFCTDQMVDQDTNNYYSVNDKNTYKERVVADGGNLEDSDCLTDFNDYFSEYVNDVSYDNDYIII
jgi:hypothetical protein